MSKPKTKIKLQDTLALWYMSDGEIKYPCAAACFLPMFDTDYFVEIITSTCGDNYTGWAYANHLTMRGGALGNDWDTAVEALVQLGFGEIHK